MCAAIACAYARARRERSAPAAAEIANPRLFDGGSEGGLTLTLALAPTLTKWRRRWRTYPNPSPHPKPNPRWRRRWPALPLGALDAHAHLGRRGRPLRQPAARAPSTSRGRAGLVSHRAGQLPRAGHLRPAGGPTTALPAPRARQAVRLHSGRTAGVGTGVGGPGTRAPRTKSRSEFILIYSRSADVSVPRLAGSSLIT